MANNNNYFHDYFGFSNTPTTEIDTKVKSIVILGENPDIDTGTVPETIWELGGVYSYPTTATTCTIASSDAADTYGTGTGAWIVLIEGLDSNYNQQWEVVNLNGTNNVTSTKSYLRVNYFRVVYSGTGRSNAGNITCTVDSKSVRYISIAEGLDQTGVYTVPANHSLFLCNATYGIIRAAAGIKGSLISQVFVQETQTDYESSKIEISSDSANNTTFALDARPKIPAKADLCYHAEYVSGNNADVAISIRGLLVHESWIGKAI